MIGIDIVKISRFNRIKKNNYKHWGKFFTANEWVYSFKSPKPQMRLGGIFAAKEAIMKALGAKYTQRFDLIEIYHNKNGKPQAKIGKKRKKNYISVSHDGEYAIAMALIKLKS